MISQLPGQASSRPDTGRIGVGPGRPVRRVAFLGIALVAALLLAVLLVPRIGDGHGLNSIDEVAAAYLTAARTGDPAALQRLTPADFESSAAIEEKIQLYRGLGERSITVRYLPPDVTPNVVAAILEADGLRDQIVIQRFGAKWYLMIGYLRDQKPGPPTAQPK